MNYSKILEQLKLFHEDELFYKDYHERKKQGRLSAEYIASLNLDEIRSRKLYIPELLKEGLPENLGEDFVFHMTQRSNIALRRHNRYTPSFSHEHDFFEIICVLQGTCHNVVSLEKFPLKQGDICLLAPHIRHALEVYSDETILLNITVKKSTFFEIFPTMLIGSDMVSAFFTSVFYQNTAFPYLIFHTGNDARLQHIILDMWAEQQQRDDYSDRLLTSWFMILLTLAVRTHSDTAGISNKQRRCSAGSLQMLHYIQEHFKTVTLSSMAEYFHYSVPYCSKLIRQSFGVTFSNLLFQIRLKKAEIYLETTNLSIGSISGRLGYENPEHFMRLFKKHYNQTPTEYRNTH